MSASPRALRVEIAFAATARARDLAAQLEAIAREIRAMEQLADTKRAATAAHTSTEWSIVVGQLGLFG